MDVRPLSDHILIEHLDLPVTKGGIIIPDTAKEKSQQAKVIAVGAGKRLDDGNHVKPEVKKGDQVLVRKYAGTEIEIEGKEYVIVREDEILGKIAQ